jgi:hypothetical protein
MEPALLLAEGPEASVWIWPHFGPAFHAYFLVCSFGIICEYKKTKNKKQKNQKTNKQKKPTTELDVAQ